MPTIQIELTNDPPHKWSTNVEHLTIFDLTCAVLKKLDPRGEDLTIRYAKNYRLWTISFGSGEIGTIRNLSSTRTEHTSKPVVKRKKSPRRSTPPGGKTKKAT